MESQISGLFAVKREVVGAERAAVVGMLQRINNAWDELSRELRRHPCKYGDRCVSTLNSIGSPVDLQDVLKYGDRSDRPMASAARDLAKLQKALVWLKSQPERSNLEARTLQYV